MHSVSPSEPAISVTGLVQSFGDVRALRALQPMSDEPPSVDEGTVRLTVRRRTGTIVEAVRRLDEVGVGVDDLGLRRPTLDDVFLSLTGHAAETADEEEKAA